MPTWEYTISEISEELIYVEEGEGCLSINRPTEGIVPRHARISLEAYDEYGNFIIDEDILDQYPDAYTIWQSQKNQ